MKSDRIEEINGILLPENVQNRCTTGVVLAVGPGKYLPNGSFLPTSVQPGTRVLYDLYGVQETKLSEKHSVSVVTMKEAQIRAIITRIEG